MERIILCTLLIAGLLTVSVIAAPVLPDIRYEFTKAGDTTSVDIVLEGISNGISGYKLQISAENPGSITITNVKFPDWIGLKNTTILPSESVIVKGVDLNDKVTKSDTKAILVTVELKSNTGEKGSLKVIPMAIDDDKGNPVFSDENKILSSITASNTVNAKKISDNAGSYLSISPSEVPVQKELTMIESAISVKGGLPIATGQITQGNIAKPINSDKGLSESSTEAVPVFSPGVPVSTVPKKNDTASQKTTIKKQPGFLIITAVFSLSLGFILFRKYRR